MTKARDLISRNAVLGNLAARVVVAVLVGCFACFVAKAQTRQESGGQGLERSHDHHQPAAPAASAESTSQWIPDVAVVDQHGKRVHFYSDLVKGKVAVIGFIYTSCTSVCPRIGSRFARLRAALGDRLDRDVALILVSTDPVTDTPSRLKEWSARASATEQVTLVTGDRGEMDKLLFALSGGGGRTGYHDPVILVGSDEAGRWSRTYGFEETAVLTSLIDQMIAMSKK